MVEKLTVRQLLEALIEAWRAGDAHRASAYFAPDAVYCESGREPIIGRDAIYAHFQRFLRDGPLWRFEVDDLVVEGCRAAVCYRFAVRVASENWHERAGCAVARLEDGMIASWREYQ